MMMDGNSNRRAVPAEMTFAMADARAAGASASALKSLLAKGLPDETAAAEGEEAQAARILLQVLEEYGLVAPDSRQGAAGEAEATSLDAADGQTAAPRRIRAFAAAVAGNEVAEVDSACGNPYEAAPEDDAIRLIKWRTPQDEVEGTARLIAAALREHEEYVARDVFAVVPSRTWANGLARALEAFRLEVSVALSDDLLRGDARDRARCGMLQAFVRAHLLADARDVAAWRMWCGIGSPDLAVAEWRRLRTYAQANGLALADALEALPVDLPGIDTLRARMKEGRAFVEQYRGLMGYSLLYACGGDCREVLERIAGEEVSAMTAATFADVFRREVLCQSFDREPAHLRIGDVDHLAAVAPSEAPEAVFVMGAVDGILPHGGNRTVQQATFAAAVAKPRAQLVISYFQKAPEAWAASFGLAGVRRKVEEGQAFRTFARSPFIDAAGDAAPFAESGEQLL